MVILRYCPDLYKIPETQNKNLGRKGDIKNDLTRKGQIYDINCTWNLKTNTSEPTYKTEPDLQS